MCNMYNVILDTDSYKASHYLQYPNGTRFVSSYIEARKNNFGFDIEGVVHFGLQAYIKRLQENPISLNQVMRAERIFMAHGEPFNRDGWWNIVNKHGGKLPIEIQSVSEGTVVPIGTPVVQIVNTDPDCPWLTSYLETAILRAVWYPSTVATLSREIKKLIRGYMEISSDTIDGLDFKLHDFGSRGVSSYESASIGGLAHLVSFMGSDSVVALLAAEEYYYEGGVVGYSIPAAEHSTITSWGEDKETEAYENMITQFAGEGKLYAVVSDSYDLFNAISNIWGDTLRDKVLSAGGTVVIRPDSGIPHEIVVQCLTLLGEKFGFTTNSKGYKVLPPQVRVIQGDGINYHSIKQILDNMLKNGWSADNVAFGMGGALLQQVNRDTLGYAMKCNAIKLESDYDWRPVSKKPKTDLGKASKAGYINNLPSIYKDGNMLSFTSFKSIRKRAKV